MKKDKKEQLPYWYKLITYWVINRKKTGLTIPFIIGAKQDFDPDSEFDSVASLFIEIKNSDFKELFVLSHCPNVREYVLGIKTVPLRIKGNVFKNDKTEVETLLATMNTEILGSTFVEVVSSLHEKYSGIIGKGYYSKIDGEWSCYDQNDKEFIDEAIEFYK
ncbi:MAG: hypothetical protein JEZ03_01630 [Bacteroidales bacterium]|nr:hypothetical protein [Bacteroidales bacterium]